MGMHGVGIKKEEGDVRHLSRERNEVLINLICTGSKKEKRARKKEKQKIICQTTRRKRKIEQR